VIPPYYDSLIAKLIVRVRTAMRHFAHVACFGDVIVEGILPPFRCIGRFWLMRISALGSWITFMNGSWLRTARLLLRTSICGRNYGARSTFSLPRLYAIATARCSKGMRYFRFVEELVAGGVVLLQYRNKSGEAQRTLEQARE